MNRVEWLTCGQYFLDAHQVMHFRAYEIADVGRQAGAVSLNAPPADLLPNALKLIEKVLGWIRWKDGSSAILVNSWYRDEAYNRAVGGAARSLHLTCGAADINKRGWSAERLALTLHREHPDRDKLGIGLYPTFVHVDIRGFLGRRAPARWAGGVGVDRGWWRAS